MLVKSIFSFKSIKCYNINGYLPRNITDNWISLIVEILLKLHQ